MCKDGSCHEHDTTTMVTVNIHKRTLLVAAGIMAKEAAQLIGNEDYGDARVALGLAAEIIQSMVTPENNMSVYMKTIKELQQELDQFFENLRKFAKEQDPVIEAIKKALKDAGVEGKIIKVPRTGI